MLRDKLNIGAGYLKRMKFKDLFEESSSKISVKLVFATVAALTCVGALSFKGGLGFFSKFSWIEGHFALLWGWAAGLITTLLVYTCYRLLSPNAPKRHHLFAVGFLALGALFQLAVGWRGDRNLILQFNLMVLLFVPIISCAYCGYLWVMLTPSKVRKCLVLSIILLIFGLTTYAMCQAYNERQRIKKCCTQNIQVPSIYDIYNNKGNFFDNFFGLPSSDRCPCFEDNHGIE